MLNLSVPSTVFKLMNRLFLPYQRSLHLVSLFSYFLKDIDEICFENFHCTWEMFQKKDIIDYLYFFISSYSYFMIRYESQGIHVLPGD